MLLIYHLYLRKTKRRNDLDLICDVWNEKVKFKENL